MTAERRITDDAAGYRVLLELLAEHGHTPEEPMPVAVETRDGLLVAALRTRRGSTSQACEMSLREA